MIAADEGLHARKLPPLESHGRHPERNARASRQTAPDDCPILCTMGAHRKPFVFFGRTWSKVQMFSPAMKGLAWRSQGFPGCLRTPECPAATSGMGKSWAKARSRCLWVSMSLGLRRGELFHHRQRHPQSLDRKNYGAFHRLVGVEASGRNEKVGLRRIVGE